MGQVKAEAAQRAADAIQESMESVSGGEWRTEFSRPGLVVVAETVCCWRDCDCPAPQEAAERQQELDDLERESNERKEEVEQAQKQFEVRAAPYNNWLFTPEMQWQSRGNWRIWQWCKLSTCTPLRYCLFTPESQWQSRGKRRISQGRARDPGAARADGAASGEQDEERIRGRALRALVSYAHATPSRYPTAYMYGGVYYREGW